MQGRLEVYGEEKSIFRHALFVLLGWYLGQRL